MIDDMPRYRRDVAKAKRILHEHLRADDNCSQTLAIQIAAYEFISTTPGVKRLSFIEAAGDLGMNANTARTCWQRARKEQRAHQPNNPT